MEIIMEQVRQEGVEFVISNGTHRLHGVLSLAEIAGLNPEQIEALKQQKFEAHLANLKVPAR